MSLESFDVECDETSFNQSNSIGPNHLNDTQIFFKNLVYSNKE